MKIAVLSDIHGNLPALLATAADIDAWQPDQVIVNGDIVNRGPCSDTVLDYLLERQEKDSWRLLRGNHETYLLTFARPDYSPDNPAFEIERFAYWAYQQLNGSIQHLKQMPDLYELTAPDSSEFRVVHASMSNNRDGLYVEQSADDLAQRFMPAPDVFVTGHTHQAFKRQVGKTLVVNIGAVGAPFDFDWRPAYGRFTWRPQQGWQAEVQRVPYDRRLIEADYVRYRFLEEAGPLAQLMLVELRRARGLIHVWAKHYEQAVRQGEIDIEQSVKNILSRKNVRPYLGPPGWEL
jgi:predicted phosphodiesterase